MQQSLLKLEKQLQCCNLNTVKLCKSPSCMFLCNSILRDSRGTYVILWPVIAQGNHITFQYCRVLHFNERWEENTQHVIFTFHTTLLSVSIYAAHDKSSKRCIKVIYNLKRSMCFQIWRLNHSILARVRVRRVTGT